VIIFAIVFFATLILDLLTKYLVMGELGHRFSLGDGFMSVFYAENRGVAFGWLYGAGSVLAGVTAGIIAIAVIFYVVHRVGLQRKGRKIPKLLDISFALFLSGSLGNLFDRLVHGYVRDFIRLDFWASFPIFNFADVFINVGVVLIVVYILFMEGSKLGKKTKVGQLPVEPQPTNDSKPN